MDKPHVLTSGAPGSTAPISAVLSFMDTAKWRSPAPASRPAPPGCILHGPESEKLSGNSAFQGLPLMTGCWACANLQASSACSALRGSLPPAAPNSCPGSRVPKAWACCPLRRGRLPPVCASLSKLAGMSVFAHRLPAAVPWAACPHCALKSL